MSKEVLRLAAPFLVNGTNRTELNYDLSELTIEAVSQAQALKSKLTGLSASATPQVAQTDYAFHIALGMKAICAVEPDVSEEDLLRIKGYDITQIAMIGTRFFIPPASNQEKNSEELQEVTQDTTSVQ